MSCFRTAKHDNSNFIKVELDPNGGSNYTNIGVKQLMSVPFAMVADKVSMNSTNSSLNDNIIENKYSNLAIFSSNDNKTYFFNAQTNTWTGQVGGSSSSISIVISATN